MEAKQKTGAIKNQSKNENNNLIYYCIVFAIFLFGKLAFHYADTKSLQFILAPVNKVLGILLGLRSVYQSGEGYYYESLNIIINKDCSGINFLLISFLAFSYLILQYHDKALKKIAEIVLVLFSSYLFTIFVNTARILTAIILQHGKIKLFLNHQMHFHEGIGIIVNLTFLILAYVLAEKNLNNKNQGKKNEKNT